MATWTTTEESVTWTAVDDPSVTWTVNVNPTVTGGGGVTDHGALTGLSDDDHTQYLNNARGDARYQPLDSDLTAIAALTTTSFGRSLLTAASAAGLRSTIGIGWHVIHDETLGSAGLFNEPSLSGYTRVRITVIGQVATTGSTSSAVRMRINGDTSNNYGTQTAGYSGSWNGVGTFTTVQTNTDRSSRWQCELELGGVGRHTVGWYNNMHVVSTGTVGTTLATGSLYYVNTSAAITSFEVYNAAGVNFTAGSRMVVEAWT